MNRRELLKNIGLLTAGAVILPAGIASSQSNINATADGGFRYCLNTSTISGKKEGVRKYIEVAARAGYEGVELWVDDVKNYKAQGLSLKTLSQLLRDSHLVVEDAIGFAPWMVDDDAQRNAGFAQMREEMLLMAELGCKRIAAPSSGVKPEVTLDLKKVGARYKELLSLGRETGVMPQLEFWGSSPVFYSLGQALQAAAAANDPDVHILPDVYHLFRGDSGFDCLDMVNGRIIDVIHFNDYPASPLRTALTDSDRVYPGDGIAPFKKIITSLRNMGGVKVLSLEVFNKEYWAQDPLLVAKTGLNKMRNIVASIDK